MTTATDHRSDAFERGLEGKPMTEAQKRAAERDPSVLDAWKEGRADRKAAPPKSETTTPARSASTTKVASSSRTATTGTGGSSTSSTPHKRIRDSRELAGEGIVRGAKRAGRNTAKTAKRVHRSATAAAAAPAVGIATEIWHLVLVSIGMAALYLVLTHASIVTGFIGGLSKALDWLISPVKVL